jgi:hypothetical protein
MADLKQLKGYNGNVNLKRSNQNIEWTTDLIAEYVKCSEDPIYFIESHMKIININVGLVSFKLYDYQKDMILAMKENRFNVIATARQAGKSTVTCGFILWYIIFHADKTVALLANKGETAREILGRVQLAYEHLPRWLQHGVKEWNKGSFELENNSRVIATATSTSAIRGYSINLLFIDEAAFIENWDTFFTSVYPTISSGEESKIILVSTPNGLNHFYAIWQNAKDGKNGYHPIQVMWDAVPGRDEKWKSDTLGSMNFDTEKFQQEYCVEFMGSSGTLIAGWKLKQLVYRTPLQVKDGLAVYFAPVKSSRYAIIVDVSEGRSLDYSAFHVIDVTEMPYQQVCTYRNNLITPLDYAEVVHRLAVAYNHAPILVEVNNMGAQVSHALHYDFEYDNILFTENNGRNGKKISTGFGTGVDMGVRTTVPVKANGCSLLKLLIEQNQLIINDFHTIEELARFSRKGKSYEAEEGAHDDLVMGLVLFGWLSEQQFFKDYTDINTLMRLRDKSDEEIMQDLSPFGFIDDGRGEDIQEIIDMTPRGNWMSELKDEYL